MDQIRQLMDESIKELQVLSCLKTTEIESLFLDYISLEDQLRDIKLSVFVDEELKLDSFGDISPILKKSSKLQQQKSIVLKKRKLSSFDSKIIQQILIYFPMKSMLKLRILNKRFNKEILDYLPTKFYQFTQIKYQLFHEAVMKQQDIVDELFSNKKIMNEFYDAIDIARKAIEELTKQMISELRSFNSPPQQIEPILLVIASIIRNYQKKPNQKITWNEIKKIVSYTNFVYDLQQISVHNLTKDQVQQIDNLKHLNIDEVGQVSLAAKQFLIYMRGIQCAYNNPYFRNIVLINSEKENLIEHESNLTIIQKLIDRNIIVK